MCWTPFIRMAYSSWRLCLYLFAQLRRLATTAAAMAIGIFNLATQSRDTPVELKPGDPAPDFSLPGSDGRTYRLKDLAGRPVVIAWFPEGVHRRLNGGVQVAQCRATTTLRRLDVSYFAASVDSVESQRAVRGIARARRIRF